MLAQLQFLNRVLDTGDTSLITENNLNSDYFDSYPNEFNFIKNHITQYGQIPDKSTMCARFPEFKIITTTESVDYLLSELYKAKASSFLATTFNNIKQLMMEGRTEDAMNVYLNSFEKATTTTKITSTDILKDTTRYDQYVDKVDNKNSNKYFVTTGFYELDDIIGGWDRQDDLVTIVARSNQGKSWVLIKSAVAAMMQGLRVGLYSGEMVASKVGYRLDTLLSAYSDRYSSVQHPGISNSGLIKGRAEVQNAYKNYIENLTQSEFFKDKCFKILTPANLSGKFATVNELRAFIEKENLDILFIDQHSLLEDAKNAKSPVERAANISKDLKNLQVAMHIPIITASQQNRTKNEDGTMDLTQIAQSDRIGQDSTVVLFFDRSSSDEDAKNDVMTLHLVKSRDSVNMQDLIYRVDLDKGIFQPMNKTAAELRAEFPEDDGDNVF